MNVYEDLLNSAEKNGVKVVEKTFKSEAKGICKGRKIGINKKLSKAEKTCVLAEELGHYYLTVGNILDTTVSNNQKQEKIARKWAVNRLITIDDFLKANENGCSNIENTAEYLNVTVDFLMSAIESFKTKYGPLYETAGYTITFNDLGYCIEKKGE